MGKADLHLHTKYSDGFFSPQEVVLAAYKKGLNVIAITDHDLIEGALEAKKFVKRKRLPIEVIIGEEITTNEGEIIGLFLKQKIENDCSIFDAASDIRKQGGVIIMPHPLRVLFGFGASFKTIQKLKEKELVDGIEIYNFWDYGFFLPSSRKKKNKKWHLAPIGGSDSHHIATIGRIYTEFEGKTSVDLKKAIEKAATAAKKEKIFLPKRWEELRHIYFRFNHKQNRIKKVSFWKKIAHMLK